MNQTGNLFFHGLGNEPGYWLLIISHDLKAPGFSTVQIDNDSLYVRSYRFNPDTITWRQIWKNAG
jgi:hypothetical protein